MGPGDAANDERREYQSMKNLSELQMELRRLSGALEQLSAQVEDLKEQEDHTEADYAALEELARRDPLENPALNALPPPDRERYFRLLATAAGLDGPLTPEQLFYLCRLAAGAGERTEAIELCKMAYQTDRLEWQAAASGLKPAGNPLVLDMLMTAGLNGPASEKTLEFIAETAGLLKIEEEDLRVIAALATSLLSANYRAFVDIHAEKAYNELRHMVPKEWIEKDRCHCGYYWNKREMAIKKNGSSSSKLSAIFNNVYGNIVAIKHIDEGYVHTGDILVEFVFNMDKVFIERYKGYENLYTLPKCVPICAKSDGFVHYVPNADGSIDVWVTSASDTLENLPAVKHEEKKEE